MIYMYTDNYGLKMEHLIHQLEQYQQHHHPLKMNKIL